MPPRPAVASLSCSGQGTTKWSAARPGPYVQRRTNAIQRQMRYMGGSDYLRTLD